jgi:hypothetical protein
MHVGPPSGDPVDIGNDNAEYEEREDNDGKQNWMIDHGCAPYSQP